MKILYIAKVEYFTQLLYLYLCGQHYIVTQALLIRTTLIKTDYCFAGKDITQKLYSLNEHLCGITEDNEQKRQNELRHLSNRSLSLDAVNTGTTGRVRSMFFKATQRKPSFSSSGCEYPFVFSYIFSIHFHVSNIIYYSCCCEYIMR